jgi:tetratricopeptide (TPR) repeat protein
MPIGAIDGMPGAGKTTLAVHWAHLVAGRFPDGQLYANLRGFDLSGPLSPAQALRGFLAALGMPPQRIPVGLDGQAALFRSLLSGQRVLVVLDNARDTDQVRPLLPGSPGCMVIVTSRNRLTGLVATDGAQPLTLDVFSVADARETLARRLGAGRVAAEPTAADEIIALSGRLPLALALVAARATAHPHFPLTAIAGELRDAQGSLDAFSHDGAADVRAVFSWSYRMLSPAAARMFRLLAAHCGPDISVPAAASLAGVPARQARALLAELTGNRLLTEHSPGRFGLHDLLRSYAGELSALADSAAVRQAATARLLGYYLHSAHRCYLLFRPHQAAPEPEGPPPDTEPERPADYAAALAWFVAERRVLEAAVRYAAQHGHGRHAWQLAYRMTLFYQRRGLWDDWAATARAALDAARADGDLAGQAHLHRVLGGALFFLGHSTAALLELEAARELFTRLGYTTEHADLHSNFGAVLGRLGRYEEAAQHHRRALQLYRAAGQRVGEALAMAGIGSCANRLGRYGVAIRSIRSAMRLHQELADPGGEANSWASLGEAYHLVGEYRQAAGCAQRAISLYRDLGSRADEAEALVALGDSQRAAGQEPAARATFLRALDILAELRLPLADSVRARLAELTGPAGPAGPAEVRASTS